MSQVTYRMCVVKARLYLDEVKVYQLNICELAMTVVTITNGGLGSEKYYTITDFARDIGMKKNTLSKWLEIYNDVYSKLDQVGNEKELWQVSKKINKQLKHERTEINKSAGRTNSHFGKKVQDTSKDRIQDLEKLINEKPFMSEFRQAMQQAIHMDNLFDRRDLNIITDSELLRLSITLNRISSKINNHLRDNENNNAYKYA